MKKAYILFLTTFLLSSCSLFPREAKVETVTQTGETTQEEKELLPEEKETEVVQNDTPLSGEERTDFQIRFEKALASYVDEDYKSVIQILDETLELYGHDEEINDIVASHEMGKKYHAGTLGVKGGMEAIFQRFNSLYDAGKYDELDTEIDAFLSEYGDTQAAKDFIENTQIGQEYTLGVFGSRRLESLYDEGKYDELKLEVEKFLELHGETELGKNFLENTQVGQEYSSDSFGASKEADFEVIFIGFTKLYDAGKYDELKKEIDIFLEEYGKTPSAKDFLANTQIGQEYLSNTLGAGKGKEVLEILEKLIALYNAGDYATLKTEIEKFLSEYGDTETAKDFLANTQIGQEYSLGTLGSGKGGKLLEILEKFTALYDAGDYATLKTEIEKFLSEYGETEAAKDFLANTQIGQEYSSNTLGASVELYDRFDLMYLNGEYIQLEQEIDNLVAKYPESDVLKTFLEKTEAGKWYQGEITYEKEIFKTACEILQGELKNGNLYLPLTNVPTLYSDNNLPTGSVMYQMLQGIEITEDDEQLVRDFLALQCRITKIITK